ncbi:hypothetical protein LNP17_04800 [Klebsiella variicola subsp. variicola]|nr:hypothetical protein [Klebsiella variicola subsp. variicola]
MEVVQRLMRFCSIEMGSFYLDIIKDRQYTAKADSVARRSCQTALFRYRGSAGALDGADRNPSPRTKSGVTCRAIVRNMSSPASGMKGLFGLADDEAMNDGFWDELLRCAAKSTR